jgi:hypothetical protein
MPNFLVYVLTIAISFVGISEAVAKGGGHSRSYESGTGSSHSSVSVHGYTKKDGTHVSGHKRSAADGNFNNNWSTKNNTNPYTGKEGTKNSPPAKR